MNCLKCAKCVQVCDSYKKFHDEVYSPRGYFELILALKNNEIDLDNEILSILNECTFCDKCKEICTENIDISFLIKEIKG